MSFVLFITEEKSRGHQLNTHTKIISLKEMMASKYGIHGHERLSPGRHKFFEIRKKFESTDQDSYTIHVYQNYRIGSHPPASNL
jgi:hypothetical protein